MSRVPRMNESCLTYEWGMSHSTLSNTRVRGTSANTALLHCLDTMRTRHISHVIESRLTYEWVMSHSAVPNTRECFSTTRLPWFCAHRVEWVTSHMWMGHVPHVNESRLTYEWVMSHSAVPNTRVRFSTTRLPWFCANYRPHLPFQLVLPPNRYAYVTWLIYIYDMSHKYTWHGSYISATQLNADPICHFNL